MLHQKNLYLYLIFIINLAFILWIMVEEHFTSQNVLTGLKFDVNIYFYGYVKTMRWTFDGLEQICLIKVVM